MNPYVTGNTIKKLREAKKLTQADFANILAVSDKTISKWETGKGYPDITLLEPIAKALNISVMELLSGDTITNRNRSSNMLRSKLYVCPICGNVISSIGDSVVSCCGITLPALEAEEPDASHALKLEKVEDDYYVTVNHEMTKNHYISFFAAVTHDAIQIVKMYPEGNAQVRFNRAKVRILYAYCNKHGLFQVKV